MEKVLEKKEATTGFHLPKKTVMLVPVKRKGQWLPSNHEASFLFNTSRYTLVVPRRQTSPGNFIDPLTVEEREFFENKELSGLSINKGELTTEYKDGKTYWGQFSVPLDKSPLRLDLSDPHQYLIYKVCLVNKDYIAPSGADKYKRATYKYAIQDEEYESVEGYSKAEKRSRAYAKLDEVKNSPTKMSNILKVYDNRKKPAKNASVEFLVNEIDKAITADLEGFLKVVDDTNFLTKLLIEQGIEVGGIIKQGTNYLFPSGEKFASSLEDAVNYFDSKKNSEQRVILESRVENLK